MQVAISATDAGWTSPLLRREEFKATGISVLQRVKSLGTPSASPQPEHVYQGTDVVPDDRKYWQRRDPTTFCLIARVVHSGTTTALSSPPSSPSKQLLFGHSRSASGGDAVKPPMSPGIAAKLAAWQRGASAKANGVTEL
jgi:hypothetical protein